jgi:glutathione peroxidase
MSSVQKIPFQQMDGSKSTLADFSGKVLLVVNVASKCGLTPQYEGLEIIQKKYEDQGFSVLGFPANNFLAQEPGSNKEIAQFCKFNYDVTFPVLSKISVKGEDEHPLYAALIKEQPKAQGIPGSGLAAKLEEIGQKRESEFGILWNFEKFLVNRKGEVVARFAPDVIPTNEIITLAIEKSLKEK